MEFGLDFLSTLNWCNVVYVHKVMPLPLAKFLGCIALDIGFSFINPMHAIGICLKVPFDILLEIHGFSTRISLHGGLTYDYVGKMAD